MAEQRFRQVAKVSSLTKLGPIGAIENTGMNDNGRD